MNASVRERTRTVEAVGITVGAGALIGLYVLPALEAFTRGHPNAAAILVTDLLFGWTVIGWGIALVWACTAFTRPVRY